jgi:hypothetical protein
MKRIDDLEVIKPGKSYINKDLGIEVFFKDPGWGVSPLRQLLPYIASVMDPSCSTVRKVPFLSCGWTTANPNEYKNNRSNIVGSISPFLSDGRMKFLEPRYKKDVIDLACHLIQSFSPLGIHPTPFYHSDPKIRDMRKEMAHTFLETLGVSSTELHKKFFLAEGIGFIFNNFVPFHLDGMNDPSSGMNETLAINCQCLINKELSLVPSVKKAMNYFHLEVGDPLSFSMVLYSRKVVGDYIKKQLKLKSIMDAKDPGKDQKLPDCWWLLKPLLEKIEEVESEANTNAVWDDFSLLDKYKTMSQSDPNTEVYDGKYCSLDTGYDNCRHWSCVKYLFDAMEAHKVLWWNRNDALGFICFASMETSNTLVLSEIIDDVLCSYIPKQHSLIQEAKKYGMYAALIFAAHRNNHDVCNDMEHGCSKLCRHDYTNKDACAVFFPSDEDHKEISDRCANIVHKIANACIALHESMKDMGTKRRKDAIDSEAMAFYNKVKTLVGPSVSDHKVLDFIQLACIFGFLPFDMIGWAPIYSTNSNAYKAINELHKCAFQQKGELPLEDATKHFNTAVKYIGSNVSWNFTPALAHNILCKLHRDMSKTSTDDSRLRPDLLYFYNHRKDVMHHLYRWKMESCSKATLQMLLIKNSGKVAGIYNIMEVSRDGMKYGSSSYHSYWSSGWDEVGVQRRAKYILSNKLCRYFA